MSFGKRWKSLNKTLGVISLKIILEDQLIIFDNYQTIDLRKFVDLNSRVDVEESFL